MKQLARINNAANAKRRARRLSVRVGEILAANHHADSDNVRHTLILLEQPPLGRIHTLPPARGLQAASRSERAQTKPLARGLPNDKVA